MEKRKRRDGFKGEKLISIPQAVLKNAISLNPVLGQLYVTHIGYFPKAANHYCERKHGCKDNILLYCTRGKGWYSIDRQVFELHANEYVIIPATTRALQYGADEKDPWTIHWVHFTGRDMDTFNHSFGIGDQLSPRQIALNESGLQIWDSMYTQLEMGFGTENFNIANLSLYYLIATFLATGKAANAQKPDKRKDMVRESIMYMRSRLGEKLTVKDMALHSNLSVSHFSNMFTLETGMGPMDYFIHLKLQKACLLLYSSETRIKNIAMEIGYDDPYYFSRLFKKNMKSSPHKYREMIRTAEGVGGESS